MRTLELLLPGVLGPVKDRESIAPVLPEMPALAHILARAARRPGRASTMEVDLCRRCGVSGPPWPFAALARYGEPGHEQIAERSNWLRVDPVHLRVDMTHARLFGPPAVAVAPAEAEALLETLNRHLQAHTDLQVEAPAAERWYVRLGEAPDLITHTPTDVAGRNIDHFLPAGAAGPEWRGLMNEVQMLLHDHPTNQEREARGALPINSIWPWGAGALPAALPAKGIERIWADEPIIRGLGRSVGACVAELPPALTDLEAGAGHNLVVDPTPRDALVHGDAEAWIGALSAVEQRWLAPAVDQLQQGHWDALVLRTEGESTYTVGRAGLRLRFWRRARPWTDWLEREA